MGTCGSAARASASQTSILCGERARTNHTRGWSRAARARAPLCAGKAAGVWGGHRCPRRGDAHAVVAGGEYDARATPARKDKIAMPPELAPSPELLLLLSVVARELGALGTAGLLAALERTTASGAERRGGGGGGGGARGRWVAGAGPYGDTPSTHRVDAGELGAAVDRAAGALLTRYATRCGDGLAGELRRFFNDDVNWLSVEEPRGVSYYADRALQVCARLAICVPEYAACI